MFLSDQESDRYENGHSYSGTIGMCDGVSKEYVTIKGRKEAIDWLADNAEKWEEAKIVKVIEEKESYFLIGGWCSS